MKRISHRTVLRQMNQRRTVRRLGKLTGFYKWRFGDAFLLQGTARQYEYLMAR